MSKAYTITFHWATNYGAILQAYALQETLKALGMETRIIDYIPKQYKKTLFRCLRGRSVQQIRKQLRDYRKEKKLEKFRKVYLQRTERFETQAQLEAYEWEEACYFSGSDQVWNPYFTMQGEGKPTSVYYLGFAPETCRKTAYAVSFGVTEMSTEMSRFIQPYLERLDRISVREKTGQTLVEDLGLQAQLVCDPVFLLSKGKYEELIRRSASREQKVFRYMLHQNSLSETDLLSMEEWLSGIQNAKLVVTNSFHATAMALIFHVPFVTVLVQGSGMNDRIITLLETVGLTDRIVEKWEESMLTKITQDIPWNQVDERLSFIRKDSMDFLMKERND